jgi:3-oxoacyl-[acyl-carrier protein] reductase
MDERVAVVIGGASGIGAAIVRALAADGCRATVADRDLQGAEDLAAKLGEPHAAAQVEVSDEGSVQALFDSVVAREGRLDVVVNCAGVSTIGLITDLDADEFRRVVDVDLTGGFLVLKHAGQRLRDGGTILTLTSLNARQPGAGMSAYCAAKAGLAMLVQVAALEMADRGIRVNAISPGLVETPLTAPALDIPGIKEDYLENTPLGRAGTPEDVAAAARFLCSSDATWLTGEVLDLNGGAHLRRYPDLLTHITKAFG